MPPRPGGPDPRTNDRLNEALEMLRSGQTERALAMVRKVLQRAPNHPEANHFASQMLLMLNQPEPALYHAERAVAASESNHRFHLGLGAALSNLNRHEEAYAAIRLGSLAAPDDAEGQYALGSVAIDLGRYDEGETALREAARLRPDWIDPPLALASCLLNTARAGEAVASLRGLVASNPDHLPAVALLALASSYDDTLSPAESFAFHAAYGRCLERLIRPAARHANTPDPRRRIRLGLLSSELRDHSIAFFLRPLLEHIDHDRFEVIAYHTSRHEDGVTTAIREHTDRWVSCDALAPPELAKRILQDRVDILVELTGLFARNRLPTMAARPAPVQVSMIGYGNTTGVRAIDARIVDHLTDPAPAADALATESLVRLDRCFLAYRPDDDAPEPGPGNPDRPFTFGSFNDIKKMSPVTIRLWSRVLAACPGSRLLLKARELGHEEMRSMLGARFEAEGVDPARVTMLGRIEDGRSHLALYDEVDLALDPIPYHGTTTTCQALWQGVPVLTMAGRAHAGRVGVSLLTAAGLSDRIAADESDYVRLATEASARPRPTPEDRLALRRRVAGSELFDHAGLSRAVQAAYIDLWTRWCDKGHAR